MALRSSGTVLTAVAMVAAGAAAALSGGCGGDIDDEPKPDASNLGDVGSTPDASKPDGQSSATTYNDISDPTLWETFDSTTVDPKARGFTGEAYDGRYVYYVPYDTSTRSGLVLRYDPTAPFASGSSYATFDLTTVNPAAKGFIGSAFDGRYLYLAQFNNGTEYGGRIARFDTLASFSAPQSWTIFDASTVNAASKGFQGAIFDGRYVYFLPYFNTDYDGVITRYDTQGSFASAMSWSSFDMSAVNPKAHGFVSGTFDGRYLYLTPFYTETGYSSTFMRFDTKGNFTDPIAWSSFDTTTVDPNAIGYCGAVFDGHYVYFVPTYNYIFSAQGDVVRYDSTSASFTDKAAWNTFDISKANPAARGYSGAVFDGRYVTLIPNGGGGTPQGVIARYDSSAAFASATSWKTFDLTTITPKAKEFFSGSFDGRYIYMSEYWNGTQPNGLLMRFDAKSPPSLPVSYTPQLATGVASFF